MEVVLVSPTSSIDKAFAAVRGRVEVEAWHVRFAPPTHCRQQAEVCNQHKQKNK
jgi:hypothetical protein